MLQSPHWVPEYSLVTMLSYRLGVETKVSRSLQNKTRDQINEAATTLTVSWLRW